MHFLSQLSAFRDTWTNPAVLEQFANSTVAHYTDSAAMASIVTKGSRNPHLHPMVLEVSLALRRYGITVEAVWRSREDGLIQWADRGSRDFHQDNVLLDFETMQGRNCSFLLESFQNCLSRYFANMGSVWDSQSNCILCLLICSTNGRPAFYSSAVRSL